MIPNRFDGNPSASRSQPSDSVSSSVKEGEVFHNIPFALIAAVSSSASTPACDPVMLKYAKNDG